MDKTTICNQALGLIANGEVLDIAGNEPRAKKCRRYYDAGVCAALAFYDWSFARKRKQPALSAEKFDGYKYAYVIPEDSVHISRYLDENGQPLELSGNSTVVLSANNASRLILTNRKITNIVYTFKQMNSELWSPGFAEAVTFLLASKICETIPNLKNEANNKFQQYQGLIAVAKNDDVREEMKFYDKNPFKNYRGYDGSIF